MSGPVWCQDCDLQHSATRDPERPWRARCLAFPVDPGFGFVSRDYSPTPPYARCVDRNPNGNCHKFTPLRRAPEAA